MSPVRVKLCFKCKQYVVIRENDFNNSRDLLLFDKAHAGHPTQIVNKEEVANYEIWTGS